MAVLALSRSSSRGEGVGAVVYPAAPSVMTAFCFLDCFGKRIDFFRIGPQAQCRMNGQSFHRMAARSHRVGGGFGLLVLVSGGMAFVANFVGNLVENDPEFDKVCDKVCDEGEETRPL